LRRTSAWRASRRSAMVRATPCSTSPSRRINKDSPYRCVVDLIFTSKPSSYVVDNGAAEVPNFAQTLADRP
jgi:hypothetical protein